MRLFRRLDAASCGAPVVWITGAAGSGKTTLAASWLGARRRPCLWYQLDARDFDPATFFYYLREAAARLAPRRRELLPLLGPEYAGGLEAYARTFLERLGESAPEGTWLVLDDYEDLPEGAPLARLLPKALAAVPPRFHILVLSRAAPPAGFASLVASGALALVGPDELNLTAPETLALARARLGPNVARADVDAVHRQTGGWAVGTVLLLEAPARRLPAAGGAESAERQLLFDYFAAEVFDREPAPTRRLLIAIALLPEIDASTAEALAEDPRAGEALADLVRRGTFTVRLAGSPTRYRLHPLFREFLLARARRDLDAPARRAIALKNAEVLLAAGSADAAAEILVGIGAWPDAAALVRAHAPTLARQGRLASLEAWLRALPSDIVDADPWLLHWLGACRAASAPVEARPCLERAHRLFVERGDRAGALASWAGFVGTFFFVFDEFRALDAWIREMEDLGAAREPFPTVDLEAAVTFGMLAALMWRQPTHPALQQWRDRAAALLASEASAEQRMRLATYLSFYWVSWRGDLPAARRVLAEVAPLARGAAPLTEILWYVMDAHTRARAGDHAGCFAAVERGLDLARRTGVRALQHMTAIQGAYGALAAGDLAAARCYHAQASRVLGDEKASRAHADHVAAWIALCAGEVGEAEASARRSLGDAQASGSAIAIVWATQTLAHVLVERGEHDRAITLLDECLAWARQVGDAGMEHHVLLSIAWARARQGRAGDGLGPLGEGLRIGRERAYLHPFWIGWRKETMAHLAALALEHGIEPEHVRGLVGALRLSPPAEAASLGAWPWRVRIFTLGRFEVWRDGDPLSFGRRPPRKALELLKHLVALGGSDVDDEALAGALWPEGEGDAAAHALETTVYRLRHVLAASEVIVQREHRVSLDARLCWADALALPAAIERARATECADGAAERRAREVATLYRGPFLPTDGVGSRAITAMRERLRACMRRHLRDIEQCTSAAWASEHRRRCVEADPHLA